MFLLDTVIVSEFRKKKPDTGVLRWMAKQHDDQLYLSVVTLGEIERGIEKQHKADPAFADELTAWLENLTRLYADRILPVTPTIARRLGRLSAKLGHDGADLLIAATALAHGLTVVTRNSSHFEPAGVTVINPFKG
jgi:predicted nucleic acid-binding protein